ncbi:hypothetical protein BpHYR1_015699 [Brachionus plicatilis]|uniref:Uncharacterized protein n=1 Tax=Brachionus plicatilis TaxID=10195 RepID=A0A3M7RFQ8_BRAPC|nr:hypothetical protein BpHYR1_015699 [Brachionus plicatilis]
MELFNKLDKNLKIKLPQQASLKELEFHSVGSTTLISIRISPLYESAAKTGVLCFLAKSCFPKVVHWSADSVLHNSSIFWTSLTESSVLHSDGLTKAERTPTRTDAITIKEAYAIAIYYCILVQLFKPLIYLKKLICGDSFKNQKQALLPFTYMTYASIYLQDNCQGIQALNLKQPKIVAPSTILKLQRLSLENMSYSVAQLGKSIFLSINLAQSRFKLDSKKALIDRRNHDSKLLRHSI